MEGDCDPDADTSGGAVTAIQLQIQLKVQRSPSWRENYDAFATQTKGL